MEKTAFLKFHLSGMSVPALVPCNSVTGVASAIGNFHQNVLSSVDGWVDHDAGYDPELVA